MTTNGSPNLNSTSRCLGLIGLAMTVLAMPLAAFAQKPHRAVLATDLADSVANKPNAAVDVVYEGPQAEVDRIAQAYGLTVVKRLDSGAVFSGTGRQINTAASDANIADLSLNNTVRGTAIDAQAAAAAVKDVTAASTGASQLWANSSQRWGGLTGAGINVAVIDSGIDFNNEDLKSRFVACADFVKHTTDQCGDQYGHGTHVAGSIAGTGKGDATVRGMAPGAGLISLRVLSADGSGNVSDVIDAINWAIKFKNRFNIRVINLSLGHPVATSYQNDPLAKAVEHAISSGIVVLAAAGNLGKTDDGTPVIGGIISPGFAPGAITVGALNTHGTADRSDDGVATYSSRGPVGNPNVPSTWEIKPDLVAPGNAIVSTAAVGSYLWNTYPQLQVAGANGGSYLKLSGASMATGVTSGAVAQLLQSNPDLTPAQVKFALQYSAEPLAGFGLIEQGAGSLDVPMAVNVANSRGLSNLPAVRIAGAPVAAGQIAFGLVTATSDTIVWGSLSDTIVWGSSDTIVWGSSDTIVWGSTIGWGKTAIWGNSLNGSSLQFGNSLLNGQAAKVKGTSDTIVWGSLSDTIVWGSLADTIVWGSMSDTIVWGSSDTIVWGSMSDTIVWGSGDTIVWGSSDTIVWGSSCGSGPDKNGEQRPCGGA